MRTYLMIALVAAALAGPAPASAANGFGGSYCIGYREGGVDCSFTSYAQCQATKSGIDAACFARPNYATVPSPGVAAPMRSRKAPKRNAAGT
jgi:uncharacterized protein DUF3551